jgi:hypothetical protein
MGQQSLGLGHLVPAVAGQGMNADAILAKTECCNAPPGGGCYGRDFGKQWPERFPLVEADSCAVVRGNPCRFFERCVRPLGGFRDRPCPDCGKPLAKGRRYCTECAQKHRRATYYRVRREENDAEGKDAPIPNNCGTGARMTANLFGESVPVCDKPVTEGEP